ncbi:MAG: hypothetical protein PHP65_00400 [Bacilli bacterium]|nr:hypothetical protein [Bacilli bacterium]
MIVRRSNKMFSRDGTSVIAILEVEITDYYIFVFPGILSEFDILVKYKKDDTRLRTPKHIHWVADVLMKLQGNSVMTRSFLKIVQDYWLYCQPLRDRNFNNLKALIENGINENHIAEFTELNSFGEYNIEFLFIFTQLLAVQEKTNRADAYMFGTIINELLEEELDLFTVIGTAGFKGR